MGQQNNIQCKDPWKDSNWYKVIGNEIYDYKQLIVWYRCPALYTENFKCSAEKTLPSENYQSARTIPKWAPNDNWRLPTIGELDRVVAKKCDYQFPSNLIEMPPVPLWTSTKFQGGFMKINESGDVFLDRKDELAWTLYVRDFSIKEMLQEKDKISSNISRLTEEDISIINKKSVMKLTKMEIFFEDEMSRVQGGNDCYANLNQMTFSISCKLKDGAFTSSKHKIDCKGKKGNSLICTSETVESTNTNLIGNTVRINIDINDVTLKQTAFPIYKGGTLMPYKIESTYSIER